VSTLRAEQFDAVVIFTVFSQNPLAAALLAYLADIPKRLAYCRENPYHLLTNWVPDEEPYTFIRHQVRRDLDLVGTVGATTNSEQLTIHLPALDADYISLKLSSNGVDMDHRWLILHPGVSERKREYPEADWIETGKQLRELGYQVLITGTLQEKKVTERIAEGIGVNAFSIAGILTLAEFIHLIKMAPLVISVNTSTIHLAAAVQTPVIVLYALTNPQHTPWRGIGKVLPFSVHPSDHSRNEVLKFVAANYSADSVERVTPSEIIAAARAILIGPADLIPDDVLVAQTNKTLNLSAP
jgi:ADP-heptose:LPS heptosyltransferase